ncbi:proteoglycan 3-like [Equus quagga]|uniref:proteoglycan 3-like n=1 Tax=Equus quagga TaxID=89248 RepID=UPI001EE16077|nr:proteoglycan 3-like [Equus quagga]
MKHPLLLPLLLLGTVAALHLENDDPQLDIQVTQADLIQDVEGSGEQEGELALIDEVIQSEGEEADVSTNQDTFEHEEAMESDPAALGEDLQCPREEETIQLSGHPGCKTCRYFLVQTPRTFRKAENVCRRCYGGNLVSIHSSGLNNRLQCLIRGINQVQVWIGGILRGWRFCRRFRWTDGSRWNFRYWASGQHRTGRGCYMALCTRGGHWRRVPCSRHLPFICSS